MSSSVKVRGNRRGPTLHFLVILLIVSIAAIFLSSCAHNGGGRSSPPNPPVPSRGGEHGTQPKEVPEAPEKPPVAVPVPPERHDRVGEGQKPTPEAPTPELREGKAGNGRIALTFDAGASAKPTPDLLKVLSAKDVHATFFLTGKWVEQNPELAKQILLAGNEIGNHTWSHHDLRTLTDEEIVDELSKTEELVKKVTGVSTKPYFRPPYGGRDARVLRVAADEGYTCVYWTDDSWDGFKKGIQADEIEQRVLRKAKDGAIVLMHCGSWPTVEALPHIIDDLRSRGYTLVKVSELDQG